jgi:hypothetical protein
MSDDDDTAVAAAPARPRPPVKKASSGDVDDDDDETPKPGFVERLKPKLEEAKAWGLHVKEEWDEREYKGSVTDACCCTLGLLDCTYPECLGFKMRGMVCCVEGDVLACVPNLPEWDLPDGIEEWKRCIFYEGECYGRYPRLTECPDPRGAQCPVPADRVARTAGRYPPYFLEPRGPLCYGVVHCCCIEQRFAYPNDKAVPCKIGLLGIMCVQDMREDDADFDYEDTHAPENKGCCPCKPQWRPQVKLRAPQMALSARPGQLRAALAAAAAPGRDAPANQQMARDGGKGVPPTGEPLTLGKEALAVIAKIEAQVQAAAQAEATRDAAAAAARPAAQQLPHAALSTATTAAVEKAVEAAVERAVEAAVARTEAAATRLEASAAANAAAHTAALAAPPPTGPAPPEGASAVPPPRTTTTHGTPAALERARVANKEQSQGRTSKEATAPSALPSAPSAYLVEQSEVGSQIGVGGTPHVHTPTKARPAPPEEVSSLSKITKSVSSFFGDPFGGIVPTVAVSGDSPAVDAASMSASTTNPGSP